MAGSSISSRSDAVSQRHDKSANEGIGVDLDVSNDALDSRRLSLTSFQVSTFDTAMPFSVNDEDEASECSSFDLIQSFSNPNEKLFRDTLHSLPSQNLQGFSSKLIDIDTTKPSAKQSQNIGRLTGPSSSITEGGGQYSNPTTHPSLNQSLLDMGSRPLDDSSSNDIIGNDSHYRMVQESTSSPPLKDSSMDSNPLNSYAQTRPSTGGDGNSDSLSSVKQISAGQDIETEGVRQQFVEDLQQSYPDLGDITVFLNSELLKSGVLVSGTMSLEDSNGRNMSPSDHGVEPSHPLSDTGLGDLSHSPASEYELSSRRSVLSSEGVSVRGEGQAPQSCDMDYSYQDGLTQNSNSHLPEDLVTKDTISRQSADISPRSHLNQDIAKTLLNTEKKTYGDRSNAVGMEANRGFSRGLGNAAELKQAEKEDESKMQSSQLSQYRAISQRQDADVFNQQLTMHKVHHAAAGDSMTSGASLAGNSSVQYSTSEPIDISALLSRSNASSWLQRVKYFLIFYHCAIRPSLVCANVTMSVSVARMTIEVW